MLSNLDRLRQQSSELHLHRLGSREQAEFLAKLCHRIGGKPAIHGLLAEYEQRLTPAFLRVVGGNRFPTLAFHQVLR